MIMLLANDTLLVATVLINVDIFHGACCFI